jgi:RsiW-degrading membrane proteinase PrsW (M82 family)
VTAFRNLKSELIGLKNNLATLLKQMAAFVQAILDLTKLLSASFPIKITEDDKQKLTKAVHDACAEQLDEIKRYYEEIKSHSDRVSMSSLDFWSMIYLLIILAMAFALTIAANAMILHSEPLTQMLWIISAAIILPAIGLLIYKYKRNGNR